MRAVNPARAGMIRRRNWPWPTKEGKPRASGDDPRLAAPLAVILG